MEEKPKKTKTKTKIIDNTHEFDWEGFEKRRAMRREKRERKINPRTEIVVQKVSQISEEKTPKPKEIKKNSWGKSIKRFLYLGIPIGVILLYMRWKYGRNE